jgi:type II secretory pathway component GspD/PulD (secretin)
VEGPVVTRAYEVGKLLESIAADKRGGLSPAKRLNIDLKRLLTANRPGEDFSIDGTQLIVTASEQAHRRLRQFLEAWAQGGFGQISVECQFLTGLPDLSQAVGISWHYVNTSTDEPDGELPADPSDRIPRVRVATAIDDYCLVGVATLDAAKAAALRRLVQGNRRANLLQAPKVTIFNGQQASICDVTQTPFVIGLRQNAAGGREPRIAVVDEGTKIALRATCNRGKSRVQLSARIALSAIDDVRTVSTALGTEAAPIQIPRVKRCRIDVASEVEDGHSLLIGCVPGHDQKEISYVLLTVHNLGEL